MGEAAAMIGMIGAIPATLRTLEETGERLPDRKTKGGTRYWLAYSQRLLSSKTLCPRLHGLVIDDVAGVYVNQRFLSQSVALLFLGDPGGKRLLHDPVRERSSREAI
jgi:hypothetical protein